MRLVRGSGHRQKLRDTAVALAGARVVLGVTAIVKPSLPARIWVGPAATERSVRLMSRALGGRDLALGAGAVLALTSDGTVGSASAWLIAGACADGVDVAATLSAWSALPPRRRWLVLTAAGGAAVGSALLCAVLSTTDSPWPNSPHD